MCVCLALAFVCVALAACTLAGMKTPRLLVWGHVGF